MEESQSPREGYIEIGVQNTLNILSTMEEHVGDMCGYVHRGMGDPVAIHSVNVLPSEADQMLRYEKDIDGVVIEIPHARCVKAAIHYLLVPERASGGLSCHWPFLKKHAPLKRMSAGVVDQWKWAQGSTLAYVDGGYRLQWTLVPRSLTNRGMSLTKMIVTHEGYPFQKDIALALQEILQGLPSVAMRRPSLMKNRLSDLSKLNIVAEDQSFMLAMLDRAISRANLDQQLRVMLRLS